MPFKTKLTSLVNARGLTDSASLKVIRILAVALGAITGLKRFWAVYAILKLQYVMDGTFHKNQIKKNLQPLYIMADE